VNIRDLSLLERLPGLLAELIEACKPGGSVHTKCPTLSSAAARKSAALKVSIERLRPALDQAGPPPRFLKEKSPLYMRQGDPEVRAIATLLGHHGAPEQEFYAVTKKLAGELGNERVSDAMRELTWTDAQTCWVRLRPETLRVLRPWIGPFPGDADIEGWWRDKGGVPPVRTPETERIKREAAAKATEQPREKPARRPARRPKEQKPASTAVRKPRTKAAKKG
jgi:hypothetical protein